MIATGQGEGLGNSKRGAVGVKDSIAKSNKPKMRAT
jgi:hypothetical protein